MGGIEQSGESPAASTTDSPPLNIFDLDRTLVRKNSTFSFYFHLLDKGILSKWTLLRIIPLYLRVRFTKLSLTDLHNKVFSIILKGKIRERFVKEAAVFLDRFLDQHIHPVIYQRFLDAKRRGEWTFLLSSSPDIIVGEIAKRLGFDQWKGTEYAVDKEGKLCEIASLIEGTAKLQAARQIPCTSTVAYSDSMDDRLLLEWADKAVAVQPSPRLKRHARQHNWEIVE